MSDAPLVLVLPLAVVLFLIAALAGVTARGGWAGTLRRTGRLGVHSRASVASDEAFELANRVAAPVVTAAALIGGVIGVMLLVLPLSTPPAVVIGVVGLLGSLGLLIAAGVLGDKAAQTVPPAARRPEPAPACAGCTCGGAGCGSPAGTAGTT